MASREKIDQRLLSLFRIHGLSRCDSELEALIREQKWTEVDALTAQREAKIREILDSQGSGESSSQLYKPIEERFTTDEYIIPPELENIHPIVLANITSGNTIDHFTHGGLVLCGKTGTGKTDYVWFLAEQARDKVQFVDVDLDQIKESDKSAVALGTLYRQLEAQAMKEGKLYIAFFDEFETLVNKYAKHHTQVVEDTSESGSERRFSSSAHRETHQTLELNKEGEALFATLKTFISGGKRVQRVFSIFASNQTIFPEEFLRRAQQAELYTFGMPISILTKETNHFFPDYSCYCQHLPRIVNILQATYIRLNKGKRNRQLERIGGELGKLFEGLARYGSRNEDECLTQFFTRNNAYLERILTYFGCNFKRETKEVRSEESSILEFEGYTSKPTIRENGEYHGKYFPRYDLKHIRRVTLQNPTAEMTVMLDLTPGIVANWYKANRRTFESYRAAKTFLGQEIFPQLKELAEYKAKQQEKSKNNVFI